MYGKILPILVIFLSLSSLGFSEPVEPEKGQKCAVCGMDINDPKQQSQILLKNSERVHFDIIAHALEYYIKNQNNIKEFWVKDAKNNKWINANNAFFVDTKTPMGHSFLAFQSKISAKSHSSNVYTFKDMINKHKFSRSKH